MSLLLFDWSPVVAAIIAGIFSVISAGLTAWVVYIVRPPSGKRLGIVADKTHDLAATANMATTKLLRDLGADEDTGVE